MIKFLKSKINVTQIIGFIVAVLLYLGEAQMIPPNWVAFLVFSLTAVFTKLWSSVTITQTGISLDWLLFWGNVIGAIGMTASFFMDINIFNINVEVLTMVASIVNIILRTFFANQKP